MSRVGKRGKNGFPYAVLVERKNAIRKRCPRECTCEMEPVHTIELAGFDFKPTFEHTPELLVATLLRTIPFVMTGKVESAQELSYVYRR
jgi:hypothetical protein